MATTIDEPSEKSASTVSVPRGRESAGRGLRAREQDRVAEQTRHGCRDRTREHVRAHTGLLQPSVVEDGDGVPEGECFFGVVGHEDARDLRPRQRIDDLCAHLRAQFGVERAEGLVEQKHARVRGESASERDALLLTPEISWG
jgi:hypothetical protein